MAPTPDHRLPTAVPPIREWAATLTVAVQRGQRALVADLAQGHRLPPNRRRTAMDAGAVRERPLLAA